MKLQNALSIGLIIFSVSAGANTIGVSTHPFTMKKQAFGTEFNGYLANGKGMGLTTRYFNRLSEEVNMDAGIGVSDGERASRFFIGSDVQIIPDYDNQPRVSTKLVVETADEFAERHNKLTIAPTVSKGFSMSGEEVFPFIALPVTIDLNANQETYKTRMAAAIGMTGRIPFEGYENLIANLETNIGINQNYSSIVMGVTLPIQ